MNALRRPFADRLFRRLVWLIVAAIGWTGVALLGAALYAQHPPRAGFDLALILEAGRRVAAGTSPYLAGGVGQGTQVESLFYSYPPPDLLAWRPPATPHEMPPCPPWPSRRSSTRSRSPCCSATSTPGSRWHTARLFSP